MHEERDLFSQLRNSSELLPSKEFTQKTMSDLIDEEKKYSRKKKIYRHFRLSLALLTSAALVFWLVLGSGSSIVHSLKDTIQTGTPVDEKQVEIYLYHTHSKESFISELGVEDASQAHSKQINISMVGEYLTNALQKNGIHVKHEKHDFMSDLQQMNLQYEDSYKISRSYVAETLQQNKQSLDMIIDIHRSSEPRKDTTMDSEGKSFGRVSFFISPNIENADMIRNFADLVHEKIEERVPGLSMGVFIQNNSPNKSSYNQDLFEIGRAHV